MLRFLTVFLIFLALNNVASQSVIPTKNYTSACAATTCAKSGASCVGDFSQFNTTYCFAQVLANKQPTGCCPAGLYCLGNSSSLTCMKDNSGMSCKYSNSCLASVYGTNYATCYKGKCQIMYGANDACTSDDQCYSNSCSNNLCAGLDEGKNCTHPAGAKFSVCNANLYCNTSHMCAHTLNKGDACQPVATGSRPCPAGQWCAGLKCLDVGTVGSGDNCSSSLITNPMGYKSVDTYLCASGLAANQTSGKCESGKAWTQTSCTNDTDCAVVDVNSKCMCFPNGKGYCSAAAYNASLAPDTTLVAVGVSLINCLAKYNCSYYYNGPDAMAYANNDPNSCSVKNCNSYLKKFNSAPCNQMKSDGSCLYMPYCSGFPVWAIIVIVVVAILLVLAVVFVIFLVLRKRRDYSSI